MGDDGGLWICELCGYVHDPPEGDGDGGASAGLEFSGIPANRSCPGCGARRDDFSPRAS